MEQKYCRKLENIIQQELAKIFLKEFDFPKGCLVTIIKVEISQKQNQTLIYLDVLPFRFSAKVLDSLNKRSKFIEFLLKKKLAKKAIPPLYFLLYESVEDEN